MFLLENFVEKFNKYLLADTCLHASFEMGGVISLDEPEFRLNQVKERFKEIMDFVFSNKEIYLVLFVWDLDRGTLKELEKCGFNKDLAQYIGSNFKIDNYKAKKLRKNDIISLYYYPKYSFDCIEPIAQAIGAYELALEPSASIDAYFVSIDSNNELLLTLYDDRGVDFMTPEKELFNILTDKFKKYID